MKIVPNKPTITRKDLEGVLDCLINDMLISGSTLKNFESAISSLIDIKYALGTTSCTAAYHLIFNSLNIRENDEVIMPSYFNHAPLSALKICGAKAVLVDNEENSIFPSIDDIKAKITDNTKAIITAHTFGFHCDITPLLELNIPVVEDISHAIGTEYDETPVGQKGAYTVISFAPSMIITTGNGGMVMTKNSRSYSAMRDLRAGGGINFEYAMTDFQAAMGISQLLNLQKLLKRRKDIAKIYYESLRLTSHRALYPFNENYSYQSFPVLFDALSSKIEKFWKKHGIEIINPISVPLHDIEGHKGYDYPNSDRLTKKLYSLPIYPTLTKKEIERVSKTLASFI